MPRTYRAKTIKPIKAAKVHAGASDAWFYAERGKLVICVELSPNCKSGLVEIRKSQLRRWLNAQA